MGQARDLAKRLLGDRIIAFLEHKSWHPKFACGMAQIVELLLYRVADEDQRLYSNVLSLPLGMGNDLADLGESGAAVDPRLFQAVKSGDVGSIPIRRSQR